MRLVAKFILGAIAAFFLLIVVGMLLTRPEGPERDTQSALRLEGGPYAVASIDHTFVDASRPTPANGGYPAKQSRTLNATVWFPQGLTGEHPLVVFSHGFMSMRISGLYIAEHLASHGYVVVAADFPLTNYFTPGGPNVIDAVNQPGDVSHIIGSILRWDEEKRPFAGTIDSYRIGVVGTSLGGLTSTLVGYHSRWGDPRIAAVVSIAGPTALFTSDFFSRSNAPFLMIAGTSDAMIDYTLNAEPVPALVDGSSMITISGGTHAGFAQPTSGLMRLLGNPDAIGCRAVVPHLPEENSEFEVGSFGGAAEGIATEAKIPLPCTNGASDESISAGRQQMITKLAVHAFFESEFAKDPGQRIANDDFLMETLPGEFEEVSSQRETKA